MRFAIFQQSGQLQAVIIRHSLPGCKKEAFDFIMKTQMKTIMKTKSNCNLSTIFTLLTLSTFLQAHEFHHFNPSWFKHFMRTFDCRSDMK